MNRPRISVARHEEAEVSESRRHAPCTPSFRLGITTVNLRARPRPISNLNPSTRPDRQVWHSGRPIIPGASDLQDATGHTIGPAKTLMV